MLSNDYFSVFTIRDEGFLTVGFGQMLPIQLFYTGLDLYVFIRNDFEPGVPIFVEHCGG